MPQYCPRPWLDPVPKPFLGNLQEVTPLPTGVTCATFYYGKKMSPIAGSSLIAVMNERPNMSDLIVVDSVSGRRWHLILPA